MDPRQMDPEHRKILNKYLGEIEARLEGVPFPARKEFIAEIRSHLVEKWERSGEKTSESLLQIINDFGDPQEIAQDYLAKAGLEARPQGSYPPTWLILALTVLFWPVGIILAWISPAWRLRDKIIATLIPVIVFLLFVMSFFAVTTSVGEVHKLTPQIQVETEVER